MEKNTNIVKTKYYHGQYLDLPHYYVAQRFQESTREYFTRQTFVKGIILGLEVTYLEPDLTAKPPQKSPRIKIEPGIAIDGLGRQIILRETYELRIPSSSTFSKGILTVAQHYRVIEHNIIIDKPLFSLQEDSANNKSNPKTVWIAKLTRSGRQSWHLNPYQPQAKVKIKEKTTAQSVIQRGLGITTAKNGQELIITPGLATTQNGNTIHLHNLLEYINEDLHFDGEQFSISIYKLLRFQPEIFQLSLDINYNVALLWRPYDSVTDLIFEQKTNLSQNKNKVTLGTIKIDSRTNKIIVSTEGTRQSKIRTFNKYPFFYPNRILWRENGENPELVSGLEDNKMPFEVIAEVKNKKLNSQYIKGSIQSTFCVSPPMIPIGGTVSLSWKIPRNTTVNLYARNMITKHTQTHSKPSTPLVLIDVKHTTLYTLEMKDETKQVIDTLQTMVFVDNPPII